ncbi:MAG: ion transporter [Pseudomonadota bacterium]
MANVPLESQRLRDRLTLWIESRPVQYAITALIVLNAIALGLETSAAINDRIGPALTLLEQSVLAVFVVEILVKLYCYRHRFFYSGWNLMDFAIVGISLLPASGPLAILRSLRILRVLRLLSTVPRLRALTESLLAALPSIGWILFMLSLVFYIFGVLGTELFGARFPDWFGTLGASLYSLFQIMTLESWSMGIARPVMAEFPWAWTYFVPFILISAFTILNLFIGIIVNSMQSLHWEEEEQKRLESEEAAHEEREDLMRLVREMAARLERMEARERAGRSPPQP